MSNYKSKAESKFVKLRGLSFHYLEWENVGKPLIIMLHGFLDHAHTFDLLADKLSKDYHLIAWDARGFGKSEHIAPYSYYYFFDYIFDLDLFIENFTDKPVILLGHSMGGIISSFYSGVYPQKVFKLVNLEGWFLSDYPFEDSVNKAQMWIDGVKNIKGFKPMKDLEEAKIKLLKGDPMMDSDFALHLAEKCTVEKDGFLFWNHDPLHKTISPQQTYYGQIKSFLDKVECPVLLIQGDKTFFELEKYEKNLELYKNSEKIEIKDAGHNLHIHKPDEITVLIKNFLDK